MDTELGAYESLSPGEEFEARATALREKREEYELRMGVKAKHVETIYCPENTSWMMKRLSGRIAGRVVVEIGAGHGVLAVEMAKMARRVFAIESDPMWTCEYAQTLYKTRPTNLTWIFDAAENVIRAGLCRAMKADVAVVVTGSDDYNLRKLAEQFVRSKGDVVMPWQDWHDGIAVIDYHGDTPPARSEPAETEFGWMKP